MTLRQLKSQFHKDLKELYPLNEINSMCNLLFFDQLGLNTIDLALQPNIILKQNDLDFFLSALSALQQEKPVQYILGKTEFYGLKFNVNNNVLIPRPETEELVDWIVKETDKKQDLSILDIGTGSGCIAISLAKHLPKASVTGLDISEEALKTTEKNATINQVHIQLIKKNILELTPEKLQFDIIVSNPPYVRELEKREIKNNVLLHEPHLALFVENDNPLLFYEKVADFAKKQLNKNGILYLEINQYLSTETVNLLKLKGFQNIDLRKDIFDNYRMIKATL
tara:strand:+ start:187156 stop:188001 length:846 start_codon:yes stop_codon:yes gene_type:complete